MFETIVIATDGSESVQRAVDVALDLARRFEATVHTISIVDTDEIESSPERLQDEMERALKEQAEEALADVAASTDVDVTTSVRVGRPATEIREYAEARDADLVAMGTRGRHGENRFLLGSVAERVVRTCPMPVLTVRQLASDETL
ncbi:universal stress protein [Salinigranum halophilum]|jgi:nucleotide-binding universal stress UspA family protein|uniref:universal stress protein n=1 Tax=Salinigranum halophilum TaxID=2565931 RepID=UPI0010A8C8EE|nr:universal stress protein [Salinigranum halophilum]